VLLVPGFMADEKSLIALKLFLQRKGYDVHTWGLGATWVFAASMPVPCRRKFATCTTSPARKVSLVGWSLGGVFSMYGRRKHAGMRALHHHAGQPGQCGRRAAASPPMWSRRCTGWCRTGWVPNAHVMLPRAKSTARASAAGHAHQLPVFAGRWCGAAAQEATIDGDPACTRTSAYHGSHVGLGFNGIVLAIVADTPGAARRRVAAIPAQGLLLASV
jgi:hypothetical protein